MNNVFAFDPKSFALKSFDTTQFETLFIAPVRAFAALSVDYTEKLINAQLEATQAYTDTSLAQLRNLAEIKDAEGLKGYLESQQQVAKELSERVKGDAEKAVALQQNFIQESQKLTEGSVKQAQESVKQATATKTVKEAAPKAKQA